MQRRHSALWLYIGLAIAIFISVALLNLAKAFLDKAFLVQTFKWLGVYSPLFFVLLFTIALSLGFPGNVLAVVGGAVYGLGWGTLWSLLGSTLGAIVAFFLARSLLHQWVKQHFGQHPLLHWLNRAIGEHPFTFVLAVRFTPLSPFSLVNFLFGLTPIDLKTYTLGTFLGLIPLTVAYAWLGVSGNQALHGGNQLSLYLALGFLTLLSVLPLLGKEPLRLLPLPNQMAWASKRASLQRRRKR